MTDYDDWAAELDPEVDNPTLSGPVATGLDRIAETLGDSAVWDGPPPSLRDRIMAQATAESGSPVIEPPVIEPPVVEPRAVEPRIVVDPLDRTGPITPARTRARMRWAGTALTAAAGAAVAAALFLAIPRLTDDGGDTSTFEVAGTELAPDAQATVDVEPLGPGVEITLHITGLPPAGEGEYYAGWLTSPGGDQVAIGSFHWREGGIPIVLWSGVDVERYPTLGVTLQREGEPTLSNGQLVLKGSLVDQD